MTISINRAWADVSGTDGIADSEDALEINFLLYADNDEDEQDIVDFLQEPSNIPRTYMGLSLNGCPFQRKDDTDDYWEATASYVNGKDPSALPKLQANEVRWQIVAGSGGGTQKQTFSRRLVSEHLATGLTVPTLDGTEAETAMGIVYQDGDFEIEGIDVNVGGTQISLQTVWDYATAMTGGRLLAATEYTNIHATNSAPWKIFPAGTLQLETFSFSNRPGDEPVFDIDITMTFSRNLTNINVGNGITVPSKKGHQVLDILYLKKQVAGLPIPVPIRAAVHEPFEEINFTAVLGI